MLRTVLLLSSICGLVRCSGVGLPHLGSGAPVAVRPVPAPVVTAASSQYFQRTFNRLVVPQVVAPVASVAPPSLAPVFPGVAPVHTVFVEPTKTVPVAVNPPPPQEVPVQPNVAIAVATAHAAAPVATILLPPYPFGFPPTFGLIPSEQPTNVPDENTKEPTTQRTTEAEATTTTPEPESTTPIDTSSSDNSFVQALPSNEDVNFNLYGPPQQEPRPQLPQPQQPASQFRPQQPNGQFHPQQPNGQFQPQQPHSQFHPQQPNGHFQPQQPNGQFQPQQPNGQFQPQQPSPQFRPQQPKPQFQPQIPNPQFQPQRPQFQPQRPQVQLQRPQFQPQQPEFPPYPPKQQPRPQFQPQPRPQFQPRPVWPQQRPQKLKTSVEVVPVPLAYITPPPLHKTHAHVKVVKHIYSYVPASSTKVILKPVKIRPVRLVKHKIVGVHSQNLRANARDIEITTVNPFPRPNTKPPRV